MNKRINIKTRHTARSRFLSALTALALLVSGVGVSTMAFSASAATGGPTVVLSSTSATATNSASIPVTATFSESVGAFATSSINVTNATVSNLTGSSTVFTFDLNPIAQGALSVTIPADAAASTASSTGNQVSNTLNFSYDTNAPVISGVSVTPTSSGATIVWTTSQAAEGNVQYGTTSSYSASSTMETSFSTSHSATLTGLAASTTYHYQINASDQAGNMATTSDATFVTLATTTPLAAPVISNIGVSGVSSTTAVITWDTDTSANSQVTYGTSSSYGSSSVLDTTLGTSHSVTLTGLTNSTVYHFAVVSANGFGTTTSSDNTFVTAVSGSVIPLMVTGIDSVSTIASANNSFADGWKWVMHLTVPAGENAFRMKFGDFAGSPSGTIPAAGNIRISSPQSSNASTTSSGFISTGNGYGDWMYLTGDAAPTFSARQIDVTIEVKIPTSTSAGTYSTTFGAQAVPSTATSTTP